MKKQQLLIAEKKIIAQTLKTLFASKNQLQNPTEVL